MCPLDQDTKEVVPNVVENGAENASDEADIIADQDETQLANPSDNDSNLGGDGTDDIGEDRADFARGEIDVKEAMDRTTRAMDYANPITGKH